VNTGRQAEYDTKRLEYQLQTILARARLRDMTHDSPIPPPPPPARPASTACPVESDDGYAASAALLEELATDQPGYLGMDSARGADGLGITVSYWKDEESITAWRDQLDHAEARQEGRRRWYDAYALHVARVERARRFDR